jgi:hypothetical protein
VHSEPKLGSAPATKQRRSAPTSTWAHASPSASWTDRMPARDLSTLDH